MLNDRVDGMVSVRVSVRVNVRIRIKVSKVLRTVRVMVGFSDNIDVLAGSEEELVC